MARIILHEGIIILGKRILFNFFLTSILGNHFRHFVLASTIQNVEVNYSCLPNFANMIKSHNNRILSEEKTQDQLKFNYQQKDTCPLEGHSLNMELTYWYILKENTTSDKSVTTVLQKIHLIKDWFYKHRNSFKYESKANSTELSKHFREMKRKAPKNQSCIGQLLIMLNHIRTGQSR